MKKHGALFTSIVLSLLLSTGCSIYHPQAVDIPLINHAGDTRIDASVGASAWIILPDVVTLNGTVSHGFNDWFCGQIHANYGGENYYLQAAPGAYIPLGEKAVAEGYLGYGYGSAWNTSNNENGSGHTYNGKYQLPFVQLNVGWHDLGAFDIGFGIKSGYFIPDFVYHSYNSDGTENLGKYEHYTVSNLLLEPQLQVGLGNEHLKFTIRFGYSWLSHLNQSSSNFNHDYITLSTGLTFSL